MWVPRSAAEVEEAVKSGNLEETPSFDAKESLPTQKRNVDLAKDVAAMSTEGGVLLYGVGEGEEKRLTVLKPLPLVGVPERIDQIVATSISEVPYIQVKDHPISDGDSGYVSVLIPQSPRAPHQVIVGDDKRYYARGAKGNRRLGEAEVARLYQRRLEWEQDQDALLSDAIRGARFPTHPELAFLHGFTRPVVPDRQIWERAAAAAGGRRELHEDLRGAAAKAELRNLASSRLAPNWRRQGADEWLFSTLPDVDPAKEPDRADQAVDMSVNVDGRGHLFFGRAGAEAGSATVVIEPAIAGTFAAFVSFMGRFYELGAYHGQVDIGLGITDIRDAVSSSRSILSSEAYRAESYRRVGRIAAAQLLDPRAVATDMLGDFFEAINGRDDYDPFSI